MSILSLIISSSISNLFRREFIFKWPIINWFAFLIFISWRVFNWFPVSWKSAELLVCFISKRYLGPAVSDFLLQLLLHIQFETKYWGRARGSPICCQFLLKFFQRNSRSFFIKLIANLPFTCLFRWRPVPFKCSHEILLLSIVSIFRELKSLVKVWYF